VENVDLLPAWAAQELSARAAGSPAPDDDVAPSVAWAVTAENLASIPGRWPRWWRAWYRRPPCVTGPTT